MSNHLKRGDPSDTLPVSPAQDKPDSAATPRVTGWRLWTFRLLALVVAPALFFCLLELGLKLAGFGYPTTFLLPASNKGQRAYVQNNQFGWRFFGPGLSQLPAPILIPQTKPARTVRIFVFGGSAAYGDPQAQFGLPRMLQAMLSLRYPNVHFEVVNAAMTAINSYAVLPVARDCARADGDIWVIYMGNNEVVGPFGAGTVFGHQVLPLPVIRSILALKTTRVGELLDSARLWIQKRLPGKERPKGMEMFLGQQVPANDPRMTAVYDHFKRNLADIIQTGQRHGVGIVVSTVAVNLRDCAPFASAHRQGFSRADNANWEQFYKLGIKAKKEGHFQAAAKAFQSAAQIDNRYAALRFRQGKCALALGKIPDAQRQFQAACDLDTLRFRCDSQLNELIRQAVSGADSTRVRLADAQRAFAKSSPDGLPGENLFYEHVNLNFDGNYLLAKTISEQIDKLLPTWVAAGENTNLSWPSVVDCKHRLGWSDADQLYTLSEILGRISQAPFTGQLNHHEQIARLETALEKLVPAVEPAGLSNALKICEAAVAAVPDDPILYSQLALAKVRAGDPSGAVASLRRELEMLPNDVRHWFQLGLILTQKQQFEDAATAFRHVLQQNPADVMAVNNLAQLEWKLGKREQAIHEFQRMIALDPASSLAWINLGQSLEATGNKAAGKDCYRMALANRADSERNLIAMARFYQSRGRLQAAVTNYNDAIALNPGDGEARIEAGQNLLALRDYAAAARHLAEAVRLAPQSAAAHYFYGFVLGQQGKPVEAGAQFRKALDIKPDMMEARVNLGVALMKEGYSREALSQFETVLQQSPTNKLALEYSKALRNRLAPEATH